MYNTTEIELKRNYWTIWLADFQVNEQRPYDPQDRRRLATSISNNFHKKGIARFVMSKEFVKRVS